MKPFFEAADVSGLLWISKPEWAALFMLSVGVCVTHSPLV